MNRFLLNLRSVGNAEEDTGMSAKQSDIVFRRARTAADQFVSSLVGNLGEDLEFNDKHARCVGEACSVGMCAHAY